MRTTILLYTDQELQGIQRQRDARMTQGIFQLAILAIIVFVIIRAIVLRIIKTKKDNHER